MLNREMSTVTILTYDSTVDEYGQKKKDTPSETPTEMVVKIYAQSLTDKIIYTDVDYIGITKDSSITDKNRIILADGATLCDIKYVIPSGRYYQVLMRKHGK